MYLLDTSPFSSGLIFISYLLNIVKNTCVYLFIITRSFKNWKIISFIQLIVIKIVPHIRFIGNIFLLLCRYVHTNRWYIYVYIYICMYTPVRISNPKNRYWIVFHQMVILSSYSHLQYYISYLNPSILQKSKPFSLHSLSNLNPRFSLNLVASIL